MNKQIKELANRLWRVSPKDLDAMGLTYRKEFYEQELTKFAKLIVRECIGCCEQAISDPVPESVDTWLNGGSQCINEIKAHFGVE